MEIIPVKILGYKKSQRYPIWRILQSAQRMLEKEYPALRLEIKDVPTVDEILLYTPVIAFPSLMIADQLVCVGRFPSKDEIIEWLKSAINEMEHMPTP